MRIKSNISVCLATLNEGEGLADCLESVKDWADEIIVVDGRSTDRTTEIARKYKARIVITNNQPVFHINKQKAIDLAKSDWILQLDADERVTPELKDELLAISRAKREGNKPVAYWIKRRKIFLGRWIRKGGQYPDPVIRFFARGKAKLPRISVHEQMEVYGKVGWLSGHLIHLSTLSFFVYITKDNRYTSLDAQTLLRNNPGRGWGSFLRYFVWLPLSTWFSLFIRHKGYEDGFPGFVFALYSGIHHMTVYIKYWEAKETSGEDITRDWV